LTVTELPINRIRLDGGTQPRAAINEEYVAQLMADLEADVKLPPMDVFHDGTDYWLADGFHRYHAHSRAGYGHIDAKVHQGTQADAQWFSFGANRAHDAAGLRRTNDDKRRAVLAALAHPKAEAMSNRLIAEHVGVSEFMVRNHRGEMEATAIISQVTPRLGRDGKTYDTSNIGKTRKVLDEQTITVDGDTGEVIENPETVTTRTTETTSKPKAESVGVERATEAINILASIPRNDARRVAGLEMVAGWIEAHK
jgi:uncharacterized ParB-like nuclease family protein